MSGSRMGAVRGRRHEPAAGLESLCPHGPSAVPHAGTVFLFHASPLPARGRIPPGMTDSRTMRLYLLARDVGPDAPPLDASIAYADVTGVDTETIRFDLHAREEAGPLLGMLSGLADEMGDDPTLPHSFLPRYELSVADPDMECAFHLISATFDDGHLFVESGSPDWLDEAHARGAAALLAALLRQYGKGE